MRRKKKKEGRKPLLNALATLYEIGIMFIKIRQLSLGEVIVAATYEQIQNWVKIRYGFSPATCHIAHVKEICELPLRKAWNRREGTKRAKPCPLKSVEPIKQAFRHFGII